MDDFANFQPQHMLKLMNLTFSFAFDSGCITGSFNYDFVLAITLRVALIKYTHISRYMPLDKF